MPAGSRYMNRYLDAISMEADDRSAPNRSRASGLSGGPGGDIIRPQPPPSGLSRQDLPPGGRGRDNLSPPLDKPHTTPHARCRKSWLGAEHLKREIK